jgi:conjugal transfer pilus assembly protein TraA
MKMMKKILFVAAMTIGAIGAATAGTTGTEFQTLYTYFSGLIGGYGGKAATMAALIVGAIFAAGKMSPLPILFGVVFAVFIQYVPGIASGIVSATV